MAGRMHTVGGLIKAFGLGHALMILAHRALGLRGEIRLSRGPASLVVRPLDSDLFVAAQIFGHKEYALIPHHLDALRRAAEQWSKSGDAPVIIDGGANVGYSSIYFAEQFPDATVVAVEPDLEAFACLQRNCREYRNIVPLRGALWGHNDGISMDSGSNGSWSQAVAGAGEIPSYTLESIMEMFDGRVLILKLDIEGAEREVLARSSGTVADVPCIIVEPHDFLYPGRGCISPLLQVLGSKDTDTVVNGENIMFIGMKALEACRAGTH